LKLPVFLSTLSEMKKNILFLFLCALLFLPVASFGDVYYFALPSGHPFKEASVAAGIEEGVALKFGERIEIVYELDREDTVWFIAREGTFRFYLPGSFLVRNREGMLSEAGGNLPIGYEMVDKENAISLYYKPDDLVEIPEKYKADGYESREILLRREAAGAFTLMIDEAEKDGVHIRILSAFRDSRYQAYLYRRAIERYGLHQSVVAKPGHSEHQLGTTCDLTTDEIGYSLTREFEATAAFRWMRSHAYRYGISHSFPKYKERITGYIYEPWHFRYWGKERWRSYIDRMGLFFTR
jgi:LAS superfamily LD-carboxypeptidase LdcB